MTPQLLITISTFIFPVVSGIVCCAMMIPGVKNDSHSSGRLHTILALYFLSTALGWFSALMYGLFPVVFVYIQSFTYLVWLFTQVIFYHFVFRITSLGNDKRFLAWHYLAPALLCATLFIWSFFVPFGVQEEIVRSKASVVPDGYRAYFYLFTSKPALRFTYSLVYTTVILRRLIHYRRKVKDYSANEERSSLRWLDWLVVLSFVTLLMPTMTLISRELSFGLLPSIPFALIIVTQHLILAYNTLKGKYLSPRDTANEQDRQISTDEVRVGITKGAFEKYIRKHKPYLNPNLLITDIAHDLSSNRAYVSSFINTTYGMNFSRYINGLRLEEFEKLRENKENDSLSATKLIEMAGFGSYRNYQRVKEMK